MVDNDDDFVFSMGCQRTILDWVDHAWPARNDIRGAGALAGTNPTAGDTTKYMLAEADKVTRGLRAREVR